jgi:hypothetical protein
MLGTYGRSMWQTGALAQVGVSSLLQGDFIQGAEHHNFEAVVLIGKELFHYAKDNRDVTNHWMRMIRLSDKATAPACVLRSDYLKGEVHRNFEVLILEGTRLSHWSRASHADGLPWTEVGVVTEAATGPASMIQSDYRDDEDHGNFEALIPMADGLWHWYRNNATGEWKKVALVTPLPDSAGCLISSDYQNEPGHRAFEALVYERPQGNELGYLFHYYFQPSPPQWIRTREVSDRALGPGCLIQGSYKKGLPHKNLEAIAWQREFGVPVLRHYFRRDDAASLQWAEGPIIAAGVQSSPSLIQSSFKEHPDHGNFEIVFAGLDNEIWHYYRRQTDHVWVPAGTVT